LAEAVKTESRNKRPRLSQAEFPTKRNLKKTLKELSWGGLGVGGRAEKKKRKKVKS